MAQHILYNTATETLEAYLQMDEDEAKERNECLRTDSDDRRWLPVLDEDPDEEDIQWGKNLVSYTID